MSAVRYALGIDVGSKYTAAATWRDGRLDVVALGDHAHTMPSVVYQRADGEMLVGDAAQRRGMVDSYRLAADFKRDLGSDVPRRLAGAPISATELFSHLIRAVLATVSEREGGPPVHVTLTCPASWGDHRRSLLLDAAANAGLADVGLLDEPVAAAMHYASLARQRIATGTVIGVYDLGGATFDVAVLRKTPDGFTLCGRAGGSEIGGLDMDDLVFAHVRRALGADWPASADDADTRLALARLRAEVIAGKEALSSHTEVSIPVLLPSLSRQIPITREKFEQAAEPLVQETVDTVQLVAAASGVAMSQIDRILLVGGASRMPLVARLLAAELPGVTTRMDEHPKWAVCLGAAIAAGARMDVGMARNDAPLREVAAPVSAVDTPVWEFVDPALAANTIVAPGPGYGVDSDFAPPVESGSPLADPSGAAWLVRSDLDPEPVSYVVDLAAVGLTGALDVATRPAVDLRPSRSAPPAQPLVVELGGDGQSAGRPSGRALAVLVGLVLLVVLLVAFGLMRR